MSFHNQEPFSINSENVDEANISTHKISKDLKGELSISDTQRSSSREGEESLSFMPYNNMVGFLPLWYTWVLNFHRFNG